MGTVRYIGEIRFAAGLWCGVELDKPEGRHNGEKYGVRYFKCKNNHGIYVPSYKVSSSEAVNSELSQSLFRTPSVQAWKSMKLLTSRCHLKCHRVHIWESFVS